MANDIINMLLQATVDPNAINSIKKQIQSISDNIKPIKIKIDIDDKQFQTFLGQLSNVTTEVEKTQRKYQKIFEKPTQINKNLLGVDPSELEIISKEIKASVENISKLTINTNKNGKIKTALVEYKNEMGQIVQQTLQWTEHLDKANNTVKRVFQTTNFKMVDDIEKAENKVKSLEDSVLSFQKRMLGINTFKGELDIFASKYKGKYDTNIFNSLKTEIEGLQNLPLDKQASKINDLKIQWGNLKQTVMQSGSLITRTIENMGKFLRFYLAGGILVGFVRDARQGIEFIKELDKDLTQVSIIQGLTRDQTLELAQSYGVLAKEMGKTVTEISQVNTELVRQGLSLEESQKRMDTILKLSASAGISTSQSMEIITSSVNALGEESERTADIMLKAANISASDVGQIGEAFTKTASSARATGMELTELSAIISTLVEVTQESPSSLGNSIKTLLARFNTINEETGEVNKEFNNVQKAFESVGVSFLNAEGQIRPVFELLTDLSNIWNNLDKNTKMYIATQAAGVRQQNRFLAIMESFGRIQEVNNELMESGGSLNEAYSVYLNSVEASANRAKASLQQMWINAINSDSIKTFYDTSTAITDTIDKIGLLNVTVAVLSTTLLLANKNWRNFAKSVVTGEIFKGAQQMSMFSKQVNILGFSFDALRLKSIATSVGVGLLQAALTFGLSVAITAVVSGITKLINKTQELKRTNEEAIQSFTQNVEQNTKNIKRLQELESQYDSIKVKIKNHVELTNEEKNIMQEIVSMTPSIVKGYDEQGNAIYDMTKDVKDLVAELERANQLEDIKIKSKGNDFLKEAKKDAKDAQNEIANLNRELNKITEGEFKYTVSSRGTSSRKIKDGLNDLKVAYDEVVKSEGANSESARKLSQEIEKLEARKRNIIELIDIEKQKVQEATSETRNALQATARQSEGYKNLSVDMKQYVADYIKTMDILSSEDFIDLQIAVEGFVDALSQLDGEGAKDVKSLVSQYDSLKQQFIEGTISAKDFDEAIKIIIGKIVELLNLPEDIISKIFGDSTTIDKAKDSIQDTTKSITELYTTVSTAVDEYELFNQALKELNEEGEISRSTYDKLVKINEKYIGILGLEKDELISLMNTNHTKRRQMIDDMIAEQTAVINASKSKLSAYEAEVLAIEELAKAKRLLMLLETGQLTSDDRSADQQAIDNARKRVEEIENARKNIQALQGMIKLFDEVDKGKSTSKSSKDEYSALSDRYLLINQQLDKNNVLLQRNKTLQELAGDDLAKKIELMKEQITLEEYQQKLLHEKANLHRQEMKELEKSLSIQGFTFAGEGDNRIITNLDNIKGKTKEVEEQFKRYIQLQSKDLPQASQEWWNLKASIVGINGEIVKLIQTEIDALKTLQKELDDFDLEGKIKDLEKQLETTKFNHFVENITLEVAAFSNELSLLKDKLNILHPDDIAGRMDVVTDLFKASKKETRQLRDELERLSRVTPRNSQEADKLASAMQNIQQQMKQSYSNTLEYQRLLDNLRVDSIVKPFEKATEAINRELNLINYNIQSLNDGILAGFPTEAFLPIPDMTGAFIDLRSEAEKQFDEQLSIEEQIQKLKRDSLAMQLADAEQYYQDEMNKMMEHYNELVGKIAEQHKKIFELQQFANEEQKQETEKLYQDINKKIADNYVLIKETIDGNDQLIKDEKIDKYKALIEDMNLEWLNPEQDNLNTHYETVFDITNTFLSDLSSEYESTWDNIVSTVQSSADAIMSAVAKANSAVASMQSAPKPTVNSVVTSGGNVVSAYAKGTDGHPGGLAIVGDKYGRELVVLPDGTIDILGERKAELVNLPRGSQVIPNRETEDILKETGNIRGGKVKKYAKGTMPESNYAVSFSSGFSKEYNKYIKDREKILSEIAKDQAKLLSGLTDNIEKLRNSILDRIDEQLLKDVQMQSGAKLDILNQQKDNIQKYLSELKDEYDRALTKGNVDLAKQLAEKYNASLQESLKLNQDINRAIKERYDMEFALLDKKIAKIKTHTDELEYQLQLEQTLHPDNLNRINGIYDNIVDSTRNQVDLLYEALEQLKEQQSLLEVGSYEWNIIDGQINNVISKLRSANLEIAKLAKTSFTNFTGKFKDNVIGMNPEPTSPEKAEDDSDKWLEGLEKELEIQKLMKYVEENKLELNEKQLAIINQQGKIRKKELDVVQKQLELQQLLTKIENLRNQKTIQQLTQKEDGTWDFEYVADMEAISELEDQILDKRLGEIQAEKALRKELQDEAEKSRQAAVKSAQDRHAKQLEEFEKVLKNAENRMYKSIDEFRLALESTGLQFAEGWLDEAVVEYWEYFTKTAEIFVKEVLEKTKQSLQEQSKAFENTGNENGKSYVDGLINSIDEIMSGEGDIVQKQKDIINMLANQYAEFTLVGNEIGMAFVKGLIDSMGTTDQKFNFGELYNNMVTVISARFDELQDIGQDAGASLLFGLLKGINEIILNGEIEDKTQAILDLLDEMDRYGTLGQALGNEFMQGLTDTITSVADEISGEGEGALSQAINTMIGMLDSKISDFAEKGDIQGLAYAEALRIKLQEALADAEMTQEDIIALLAEFKDFDLAGLLSGEAYGDSLTEGLIGAEKDVDKSSSAIVEGLNEDVKNFGEAGKAQGEAYKNAITTAFQDAINTAKSLVGDLIDYINSGKFKVNIGIGNNLPDDLKTFGTGGFTGNSRGLAWLDEKELILDKVDTSNLLKAINITRDLFSNIKVPTIPKMQPAMASGGQVFNINNLELPNITNENGAENLVKGLKSYALQFANK